MGTNKQRVLPSYTVQADSDAFRALKNMSGYAPSNATYSIATIQSLADGLKAAQDAEKNASDVLDAKRDAKTAAEMVFHDAMLGAKNQVIAQYGDDSDELQSMGLKKKSEYRARPRTAKPAQAEKSAA